MRNIIRELVVPVIILIAVILSHAQAPDVKNLENFQEIVRDERIMYFVNVKNIEHINDRVIVIQVMGAHYQMNADGETYALNNIAYIVTTWRIDCKLRTGQRLKDVGVWKGVPVNKSFKNPKVEKPTKSRNLWIAIDAVCGDTSPELTDRDSTGRTLGVWGPVEVPRGVTGSDASRGNRSTIWIGGNGCGLIGGGANEKACCATHDFAYRQGGSFRIKWNADAQLFKCVWKRNKFLAPFVWVGAQVGGLWAFHWGKKRELGQQLQPKPR